MPRFRAILLAQSAILALSANAMAQQAQPPGEERPAPLEEIIVTATKRSMTLQDTPVAVTAFSQEGLDRAQVNDLASLQSLVPNLTVEQHGDSGGVHVYLRGIGSANHTELGDPAVAFHVDSVYSPRPQGATVLMYDVERVEVLRGPQGTLFGRNATAGVVNIITAKPRFDDFSAGGEFIVGNYQRVGTRAHVNIPVSDTFAFRLAGATERRDGFVDFQEGSLAALNRKYGAIDQVAMRGTALWQPSADFSATVAAEYYRDNGAGNIALLQTPRPGTDRYSALVDTPGFLDQDNLSFRAQIDYQPTDWLELTYIGGYNDMGRENASDNDAGAIPGFKQEHRTEWSSFESFTHEIQAKSADGGPFEWLVGAFYMEEENSIRFDIDISQIPVSRLPASGPIVIVPTEPGDTAYSMSFVQPKRTLDSKAVFAQATYSLTEELRLTGGIRRTTESKKDVGGRNWVCPDFGATVGNGGRLIGPGGPLTPETCGSAYADTGGNWPGGGFNDGKTEDSKTTWLGRAEWDINPDLMTYASVSTGFKSGGLSDGGRRHLPENLTSYEVGLKADFGRTLTFNAAAFYMDYKDLQVSAVERLPNGQQQLVTSNAAAATIKGFEGELNWAITDVDTLSGFFSVLDAEYDEFFTIDTTFFDSGNLGNTVNLAGRKLRHAPTFSATAIYEHAFEFGDGSRLVPRIQFHYETESSISPFNYVYPELYRGAGEKEAFTKTDLSIRYEAAEGNWTIEAFVQNLEDKAIKTDIQNIGASSNGTPTSAPTNLGNWVAFYNPPRTYGARVSYSF